MIANALDSDGKFTANQISRKLKKLGLRVPRQKKLKPSTLLRDEDVGDSPMDELHDSDDETLSAFRNRYVAYKFLFLSFMIGCLKIIIIVKKTFFEALRGAKSKCEKEINK